MQCPPWVRHIATKSEKDPPLVILTSYHSIEGRGTQTQTKKNKLATLHEKGCRGNRMGWCERDDWGVRERHYVLVSGQGGTRGRTVQKEDTSQECGG